MTDVLLYSSTPLFDKLSTIIPLVEFTDLPSNTFIFLRPLTIIYICQKQNFDKVEETYRLKSFAHKSKTVIILEQIEELLISKPGEFETLRSKLVIKGIDVIQTKSASETVSTLYQLYTSLQELNST